MNWPGVVICITPPHRRTSSLEALSSAGMFVIECVGTPGAQGAGNTGTQGIGVSTPSAAEVAAATVGLADRGAHPEWRDVRDRNVVR